METTEISSVAEYENCIAKIGDAEFFTDQSGKCMVRVYMEYTNNNPDGMYMFESFGIKAFQNDIELENCTDINDDEQSIPLIREVKNGQSVIGGYVFSLSDTSDITVEIRTPTADENLLARREYRYETQNTD